MMAVLVVAIGLVGLFLSGLFSGSETGLYCANRLRLELAAREGDRRASRVLRFLSDPAAALSITLMGTNVSNYVVTSATAFALAELIGVSAAKTEVYTVVFLTPVVFVFGEVTPKNLFQLFPNVLLQRGSLLLSGASAIFRLMGAVALLTAMARFLDRLVGSPADLGASEPKRRVASMLQEALAGHSLGMQHSGLIERVCGISETPVHTVMVSRNRVVTIPASADRKELMRIARRTSHARLPLTDRRATHVVGTIKVDDLLRDSEWSRVSERATPAIFVSPHQSVATTITELRRAGQDLAVVKDLAGRMLGIVTLSDSLAEIVGDLAAEDEGGTS